MKRRSTATGNGTKRGIKYAAKTAGKLAQTSFPRRTLIIMLVFALLAIGAGVVLSATGGAKTKTISVEIEDGRVRSPARRASKIRSASNGGVVAFIKPKNSSKPSTSSNNPSPSPSPSSTPSTVGKATATNTGSGASGCTIASGSKLKDQDPEDEQHPWKRTGPGKTIVNFITADVPSEWQGYMKNGAALWGKSDCVEARLVASCPAGGYCVTVKINDGGGDDGNYDEVVKGGFQSGAGLLQIDKSLSGGEKQNVTTHEMGHAIGLVHRKTAHVLMNGDTYSDVFNPDATDYYNLKVDYANQKY